MKYRRVSATLQPESAVTLPDIKLDEEQWGTLGESMMQLIDINLGNRATLDNSLDIWNAMYEMRTQERDSPWPDAANIVVPIVAAEVDGLVSRVAGTVIQPRMITVRGNDPDSTQYAHLVEQFLNSEMVENGWDKAAITGIHLSARDGTCIGQVLWELNEHERVFVMEEEQQDEQGQPIVGPDGQPVKKKVRKRAKFKDFDAPRWTAKELRDFLVVPNFAPDFDSADALCAKIYMGEEDMMRLVNAGIFKEDMVEKILSYVSTGQGDLSYDRQGYSTYTIAGRLSVVDTSVAAPKNIKMTRGPVEMWMCLSNQYDLDGDGVPETNLIWVHDRSRLMAGVAPFEYMRGIPFFDLSLWPRPNRIYGFAVPERLAGLQDEANAQRNQRLDWTDMCLQPMRYKTPNVRFRDEDRRWGPDNEVEVQNPTDFGFIPMPDIPPSSEAEERIIASDVAKVMGSPQAPALAMPQGGKRTAREAQLAAAQQGQQQNLVNSRVREWVLKMVEYSVGLYLQYGPDQLETVNHTTDGTERLTIPKEILGLDYTFGIAGMGGPFDKEARRQDMMQLYQLITGNPLVQGDLKKLWAITRSLIETFDIPEVTAWIGTLDDAKMLEQQRAQAQQAQQQQEMAMAALNHQGLHPGSKGGKQ